MFEKELEEYKNQPKWKGKIFMKDEETCFKDGLELGYNKANEWHFVKDGIMPEENQWVLVYDGSYTVCNYHSNAPIKWLDNYENEVYESTIIAWKEIVLPKESE